MRNRSTDLVVMVGVLFVLLLLGGCGPGQDETSRFGPVLSPVEDLVGVELAATRVVSLPCIPSRRDPVGVWLGVQVVDLAVSDDTFTLDLVETDARLGSHPSGCRDPEVLLAQSVFLVDGNEPILAQEQARLPDATRLVFALDGRSPAELDVVILPTFEFEMGDGLRQTTIFGLIGRYSIR